MTLEAFRKSRSASKREAILNAASESFRQDGYARTSMELVARRAEVSTATLYRHFSSKADLFEAVAQRTMDRLELPETSSGGAIRRLDTLARAYAALLSEPETRGIVRMVVSECGRDSLLADRFYAAVKSRLSDLFISAIALGVETRVLRSVKRPAEVAGQLQGMIEHATLMRGLVLGDTVGTLSTPDQIAKDALRTWLARWSAKGI